MCTRRSNTVKKVYAEFWHSAVSFSPDLRRQLHRDSLDMRKLGSEVSILMYAQIICT